MTIPSYQVQTTPTPVWSFLAGNANNSVLFVNLDNGDFITIDDNNGVSPGTSYNGAVLPPGGSIALPANSTWYAVTDQTDAPTLQVTLGGNNWTIPIGDIATQIADSGLALAIAENIAAQGLSLIGAPKALYGGLQPRTGAGIVGVTLDKWAYVPNTSDDFKQYPVWATKVGRPFSGCRRCYSQEGDVPSSSSNDGNAANSATNGFRVDHSLKPFRDATNTYGNNKIPGQGSLTFAQHLTAIKSAVVYLQSVCTNGLTICFWHECNGNGQNGPFGSGGPYGPTTTPQDQTNFHAYHNFYQQACKKATNPALTADVETAVCVAAYSPNSMVGYIVGCNGVQVYAVDYYAHDYASKKTTVPPAVDSVRAQCVTDGTKLAYWEIGLTNGSANDSVSDINTWITQEMISKNVAHMQAGHPMGDTIWFAAPSSGPGPSRNALGSGAAGNCNDPSVIANTASLFDNLSSLPSNVISVGAGASLVIAPLKPSPGAGFAIADGLSYDITLALISAGTPTVPFVQVRMDWFNNDATGGIPVETQIWRCPIGATGTVGTNITGVGPQRGQFLQITFTNLDTVACTVQIQVNSTSRNVESHDWRWDVNASVNVPTFNLANGGDFGNDLGAMNQVSVTSGGGQKRYLFGMRSGWATVRFKPPAASTMDYDLQLMPQSDMGSASLLFITLASTDQDYVATIRLPRCPVAVQATNHDGTTNRNATAHIICEG